MFISGEFGQRLVTVLVGPDKQEYLVHESVLSNVDRCSFFGVVFKNGFRETWTGCLELPEDDPYVFCKYFLPLTSQVRRHLMGFLPLALVLKWMYACCIDREIDLGFQHLDLVFLFQLYNFADKYLLLMLQNKTIDLVHDYFRLNSKNAFATIGFADQAWQELKERTPPGSPMHGLIARCMAVSLLEPVAMQKYGVQHAGDPEPQGYYPVWCWSWRDADRFMARLPDSLLRPLLERMLWVETQACGSSWVKLVGESIDFHVEPVSPGGAGPALSSLYVKVSETTWERLQSCFFYCHDLTNTEEAEGWAEGEKWAYEWQEGDRGPGSQKEESSW